MSQIERNQNVSSTSANGGKVELPISLFFLCFSFCFFSPGWPLWTREIFWVQQITRLAGGKIVGVAASVMSDDLCPLRVDEVVRGNLMGEYMVLTPLDGGKRTRFERIQRVDPGGWIPTAVINRLVSQNGNAIALAKKVLEAK
jgi:hypothetical protein